jgi:general secretion pathway protein E
MHNQLLDIFETRLRLPETTLAEIRQIEAAHQNDFPLLLLKKHLLSEEQLLKALGILYDIPCQPQLTVHDLNFDFTRLVPIQFLKKNLMVPLITAGETNGKRGDGESIPGEEGCLIAVNDPSNFQPLDDLVRILGIRDVQVVLSTQDAILSVINQAYDTSRGSA